MYLRIETPPSTNDTLEWWIISCP